MSPPLHPDIEQLAFLLGTWHGKGAGSFPTIEDFAYLEEVTFGHVGKPFVSYTQKTRDASTELPLHAEMGYLRPVGADRVELLVVHPSGIAESLEGELSGTSLNLASVHIHTTATAKEVRATTRIIDVAGDFMEYRMGMAAVGLDLTHHLAAELRRND